MVYTQRALSALELNALQVLGVPIQQYYVSQKSKQTVATIRYKTASSSSSTSALKERLQLSLGQVFGSTAGFTTVENRRIDAVAGSTASQAPSIVLPDASTSSWALDRIDERNRPLDGKFEPANGATGSGVRVYVLDTGILTTHPDFGGRVHNAYSVINNGDFTDCDGHGTHVAGLVGSATWGVARQAQLYNVRVLNCQGSGTLGGLAQALLWVRDHHTKPCVVTMSLGFYGYDSALASIIADLIEQGIVVTAAAGNDDASACTHFPSAYPDVVSVGSVSDSSDSRSSFSNWGSSCSGTANPVNIMAPGSNVKSTWNNGGTATLSGTSMATPLVAGAAALLHETLGTQNGTLVRQTLLQQCTRGLPLQNLKGAPDCLLMVGTKEQQPFSPSRTPTSTSSIKPSSLGGGVSASPPPVTSAAAAATWTVLVIASLATTCLLVSINV